MGRPERLALALVAYQTGANLLLPQALHDALYVVMNLGVGGWLVVWARRRAGLEWREMGWAWGRPSGLALAVGLGLLLPAPLFLAGVMGLGGGVVPPSAFEGPLLLYALLVRIPLGTALFEETAFRGVLLGVWVRERGLRRGVVGSSLAFGLWHLAPTWERLAGLGVPLASWQVALALAGAVAATFLGGLFFAALRLRAGSLLAPVLAHALINDLALLASTL